jgi:mercuric ion transport protein
MIVDCRDMECPRPVLETKKALDALPADATLVLEVNTLSGRENCKRFVTSKKCTFVEEVIQGDWVRLTITKGLGFVSDSTDENPMETMIRHERKNAVLILSGALVTALLSASCCLVPTLFIVFGVSFAGVVNVPELNNYRWLFAAVAFVMLSIGFYQMVIKKQIECDCVPTLMSKVLLILFWGLFVVSLLALFYPYYEFLLWQE